MKNIKTLSVIGVCVGTILLMNSCGNNKAVVKGEFISDKSHQVGLGVITPEGTVPLDSAMTDSKGRFKFSVTPPHNQPALYSISLDGQYITLLVAPKDHITVTALSGNIPNYTVKGSPESELIRQVNSIFHNGRNYLDSLAATPAIKSRDEKQRKEAMREYIQAYYGIKRDQIKFIVANSSSIAAIYALSQRLPNDDVLFNGGDDDIIYYRMVADSTAKYYPGSPYVAALQSMIREADARYELQQKLSEAMKNPVSVPDIVLPDMYGTTHRLSDIRDKVILLDFWTAENPECNANNADLRQLYGRFAGRGLEVYQVSADTSKAVWVDAVQLQKLPWITVCDFRSFSSPALTAYNVRSVPQNYIISREGDIVAKNLYGPQLEAKITELLK